MGYSERFCQLCGVSFNIGRIRRPDESADRGWRASGWGVNDNDPCEPWTKFDDPGCAQDETTDEHIAGPGCWDSGGYSGFAISYEEMKDCFKVQCLIPKDENWMVEDDDEDFVLDAKCFLSGISLHSPASFIVRSLSPPRHGIDSAMITNASAMLTRQSDLRGWAMPFHPWCFELFKRASKLHHGKIDIDGLWRLRDLQVGLHDDFQDFDRGYYIRHCRSQWWDHFSGSEFLAADPLNVPTLQQFINEYIVEQPIERLHFASNSPSHASADPFHNLPVELRYWILEYLDTPNIANLRLTSRSFRQLPNSLFRRLLQQDMPWFWEADGMPRAQTNWLGLYLRLKSFHTKKSDQYVKGPGGAKHWLQSWVQRPIILGPDLDHKGLRNRRRIWKDVQEIVRRIYEIQHEGPG